jgi:hypothetical protein
MKFDKDYNLPPEDIQVLSDQNVVNLLEKEWAALKRISVCVFEGKEDIVGSIVLTTADDKNAEDVDCIPTALSGIYRLAYMKAGELNRKVSFKVKLFVFGTTVPKIATFSAEHPELTGARERDSENLLTDTKGVDSVAGLRMIQTLASSIQSVMSMQQSLIFEANSRLTSAMERESSMAKILIDKVINDVDREGRMYDVLDKALQGTIANGQAYAELARREAMVDLEVTRERLKRDGTGEFMKFLGNQLSTAAPVLMAAAAAKMGMDPGALMTMMAAGPPPPTPPTQGPPPPRVTPSEVAEVVQVPSQAPAPSASPGAGLGSMSAEIGRSLTASQWAAMQEQLNQEQVQKLRDWLSTENKSDSDAMGAMLRCVGDSVIPRVLASTVDETQGIKLDGLLTQLYASMGSQRPAPPIEVEVQEVVETANRKAPPRRKR